MTAANEQIACPECGYGWNDYTRGFHYTHCSKVAHLSTEQPRPEQAGGGASDNWWKCTDCGTRFPPPLNAASLKHNCRASWQVSGFVNSDRSDGQRVVRITAPHPEGGGQDIIECLESVAGQIIAEHNQHSTLITQRDQLAKILSMMICHGCHNRISWTETPTKYGDWTKCSSCRAARQLLTTIEQGGTTRQ